MGPGVASSRMPGIFEAVQRKINRAPVRLGLEHARGRVGMSRGICDQDGNIAHDPSDDELIPKVQRKTLLIRSSFSTLDATWKTERGGNTEGTCPNPNAPKRDAGPSAGPEPKLVKVGDDPESELEDQASQSRSSAGLPD